MYVPRGTGEPQDGTPVSNPKEKSLKKRAWSPNQDHRSVYPGGGEPIRVIISSTSSAPDTPPLVDGCGLGNDPVAECGTGVSKGVIIVCCCCSCCLRCCAKYAALGLSALAGAPDDEEGGVVALSMFIEGSDPDVGV